jgi:hypothetical protein
MTSSKRILLLLGDIVALGLAFGSMLFIRFGNNLNSDIARLHYKPFLILGIIWLTTLFVYNLYESQFIKITLKSFRNIFLALITCLGIGFILFYLVPFPVAPKTNLVISPQLLPRPWRRPQH